MYYNTQVKNESSRLVDALQDVCFLFEKIADDNMCFNITYEDGVLSVSFSAEIPERTKKMTLNEITQAYRELIDLYDSGELPEDALNDTLESLDGDFKDKAVAYAEMIKTAEAEAKVNAERRDYYADRKKRRELFATRLRKKLLESMVLTGNRKINTPEYSLSVRTVKSAVYDDVQMIKWAETHNRDDLLKYDISINKKAVSELAKTGGTDAPVTLEPHDSLTIR